MTDKIWDKEQLIIDGINKLKQTDPNWKYVVEIPEDFGCEYCKNDGKLNENDCCPECDAQYPTEE